MDNAKIKSLAVNEHGFMFDPTTGYSYNANKTATTIVNLLREGMSLEDVLEQLSDKYEVEQEVLSRDVDFFLTQLHQFGLLD